MSLLDRINELRKAHNNISVHKLEQESGLTRGSLAKWDKHAPSYDKLKKLADYFGISVDELTGDEQQKKPAPESGPESKAAKLYDLANSLDDRDLSLLLKMAEEMAGQREQNN